MKTRQLLTLAAACLACITHSDNSVAETIYGTLTSSNSGAPLSADLRLNCGNVSAQASADSHGSYRLTVAARGRCYLMVGNMPAPGELVFVYEEPTRYDFAVQKSGNIITSLSRR